MPEELAFGNTLASSFRKRIQDAQASLTIQTMAYIRATLEVPIHSVAVKSEDNLRDTSWSEKQSSENILICCSYSYSVNRTTKDLAIIRALLVPRSYLREKNLHSLRLDQVL